MNSTEPQHHTTHDPDWSEGLRAALLSPGSQFPWLWDHEGQQCYHPMIDNGQIISPFADLALPLTDELLGAQMVHTLEALLIAPTHLNASEPWAWHTDPRFAAAIYTLTDTDAFVEVNGIRCDFAADSAWSYPATLEQTWWTPTTKPLCCLRVLYLPTQR